MSAVQKLKEGQFTGGQRLERVFDVDDARWGHPLAREAWANKMEDGEFMYDATTPLEPKIEGARAQREMMKPYEPVFDENSSCTHEWVTAPGCVEEPETSVSFHVVTPKKYADKKKPVLFLIAGGGMVACNSMLGHMKPINYYADLCGCAVISTQYRTALDAPYPAALNDLHAAFQWILDHAEERKYDTDRIVFSGVSAGAALALSLVFRLMRYGIRNIRGVLAEEPITDDRETKPSSQVINSAWNAVDHHGAYRMYLGIDQGSGRMGPEALANHATVEECIGYPPLFIHSAEYDPDSDYNREFYGKVKEAKSFAEYHCWGGIGHAGFFLAPDLAEVYNVVVANNMKTLFECDLRRPWVVEDYVNRVNARFSQSDK